jgi:hypothetical protein
MVVHLLPRGALLLVALVAQVAAQNALQGDTASDKAALLAIRASGNNDHLAMVTWTADTEPCDAASWDDDRSGWLGVQCDGPGGRVTRLYPAVDTDPDRPNSQDYNSQDYNAAGDLQLFAQLGALCDLDLNGQESITGDIAALAVLQHLRSFSCWNSAVFGEPASLSGLSNLDHLGLGNTNVAGPVGSLRALPGLGSDWGHEAVYGTADGGGCCCAAISTDGGLTHSLDENCSPPEGQEYSRLYYRGMTPCSAYAASCAEAGLALQPNAAEIAGRDQCACCVGSGIVRSASNGLCSHCATTGEQLSGGQCVRCPQPERCAEGVCVGNSEGVGCTGCLQGYFAAGSTCHECPGAGSEYIQFGLAVGAMVGICAVLWKVSEADIDGLTAADETEDLKTVSHAAASSLARISNSAIICSIALPSLFQITITFTLPSIPVPDVLRTLGTWAASVFSFDLGVVGSPECSLEVDAKDMFIAKFFLTVCARNNLAFCLASLFPNCASAVCRIWPSSGCACSLQCRS